MLEQHGAVQITVSGTKHVSGAGELIIGAYDCNGSVVDTAMNVTAQAGILEKLMLMASQICYLEIRRQEVTIDKVCFLVEWAMQSRPPP